jgi:hypothetical protein
LGKLVRREKYASLAAMYDIPPSISATTRYEYPELQSAAAKTFLTTGIRFRLNAPVVTAHSQSIERGPDASTEGPFKTVVRISRGTALAPMLELA